MSIVAEWTSLTALLPKTDIAKANRVIVTNEAKVFEAHIELAGLIGSAYEQFNAEKKQSKLKRDDFLARLEEVTNDAWSSSKLGRYTKVYKQISEKPNLIENFFKAIEISEEDLKTDFNNGFIPYCTAQADDAKMGGDGDVPVKVTTDYNFSSKAEGLAVRLMSDGTVKTENSVAELTKALDLLKKAIKANGDGEAEAQAKKDLESMKVGA
jgi:tetratricopeptide (TPR) repeat protein